MFKDAQRRIIFVLRTIEVTIAIFLTIAIVILCLPMIPAIFDLMSPGSDISDLKYMLEYAFSLIIGIEFVKMVCKPTAGNVVEVLMFAVARFIIIDHSSIMTSLLGGISIAILFATRKYLFMEVNELHEVIEVAEANEISDVSEQTELTEN
ncbi:MAG TPA: hypothetical protein GX499_06675 [Clostridiales bacterium]|nr:hypothetical protein [Clostridiales bacterium]